MIRRVMTYRPYSAKDAKNGVDATDNRVEDGEGFFSQYGVDCCEDGTYTTAIVEMDDRTVKNIDVTMIEFLEQPEQTTQEKLNEIAESTLKTNSIINTRRE